MRLRLRHFVLPMICLHASAALADSSFSHPMANPNTPAGLLATVYHLGTTATQAGVPTYQSVNNIVQFAATHSPNYAFVDTQINTSLNINLTGGDSTATRTFLGADAAFTAAADTSALNTTIVDWHGYVYFPQSATYTMSLSGDDAAAVYIGGNGTPGSGDLYLVNNYNGSIGTGGTGLPNPVHSDIFPINGVPTTGWYPIEIIYYNQYAGGNGGAGLNFSVSGPGQVQFASPRVFEPNPYHWYQFSNGGTDSDPATSDGTNATIVGGATVTNGSLVTTGTSSASGARIGSGMGAFFGSFTIEQWFTRADQAANFQTLFSVSTDQQHTLMAHPARGDNGLFSVDFRPGDGNQYSLTAAAPAANVPTHMAIVYDATTTVAKLYINSHMVSSTTIASGVNLANLAGANYTGVNGFSPFGDPSFNGATDEFRISRVPLSQAQIIQDFIEHLGQ